MKRNGNAYAIPSNICVSNEVSNVKVVFSHQQYMPLAIANVVDGVFNSKWKMIKPLMDPTLNTFVADVIRSIVVPILDNIPLQEIINMEGSNKKPHCWKEQGKHLKSLAYYECWTDFFWTLHMIIINTNGLLLIKCPTNTWTCFLLFIITGLIDHESHPYGSTYLEIFAIVKMGNS